MRVHSLFNTTSFSNRTVETGKEDEEVEGKAEGRVQLADIYPISSGNSIKIHETVRSVIKRAIIVPLATSH